MTLWTSEMKAGVVTAVYTNPPMNYFCAEGAAELGRLIESWKSPDVRAVVLTGGMRGKFITHYSVEELLALAEDREGMRKLGTALNDGYHALLASLSALPKPVVVAMNGDTMGGGFELSLACDIRIGARGDHRFGLPEVRLGILPGGSGTQRLPRLIGTARALDFILRGRVVKPEEALALGLIHEVADDARARAETLAHEMARRSPVALAMAKFAVYEGIDTDLAKGLKIEAERFLETMLSDQGLALMREYVDQPLDQRRTWLERSA
jgi:enoyl-CoA hydratase